MAVEETQLLSRAGDVERLVVDFPRKPLRKARSSSTRSTAAPQARDVMSARAMHRFARGERTGAPRISR
jgi:hypothetical protein